MMRILHLAVVVATSLGLVSFAQAKLAKVGAKPTVAFTARGPGGMTIVGTTSELEVRDDGKTVSIAVPLKGLSTGIALRDKHLREKYLQVAQYPTAELVVERATLRAPGTGAVSGEGKGVMKIHGKSKTVSFRYSARKNAGVIQVLGSVRLDIRDFNIEIPSFLGVTVKPEVDLAVAFEAKDS